MIAILLKMILNQSFQFPWNLQKLSSLFRPMTMLFTWIHSRKPFLLHSVLDTWYFRHILWSLSKRNWASTPVPYQPSCNTFSRNLSIMETSNVTLIASDETNEKNYLGQCNNETKKEQVIRLALSCGRWDLNPHENTPTRSLVLLVCQFRHFRVPLSLNNNTYYNMYFTFRQHFFSFFIIFLSNIYLHIIRHACSKILAIDKSEPLYYNHIHR